MKTREGARQRNPTETTYDPSDKNSLPAVWPACILAGRGADPVTGEPGPLCSSDNGICGGYSVCIHTWPLNCPARR